MPKRIKPARSKACQCQCGRPVLFRHTQSAVCGSQLGFSTQHLTEVAVVPRAEPSLWRNVADNSGTAYRCCAHRLSAAACNRMVRVDGPLDDDAAAEPALCLSFRLKHVGRVAAGRAAPGLQLQTAKRRLVAQLPTLGLPSPAAAPPRRPAPAWAMAYLRSHASSHPWEDWADAWAHDLHLQDTRDAAACFDIDPCMRR